MIRSIITARGFAKARSPQELRRKHAEFVAKAALARDVEITVDADNEEPVEARIAQGQWLFDCACGAGVITHPEWKLGCCFGCGAVYSNVLFPDDFRAVERLLLKRSKLDNRNWLPGETVHDIAAENDAHGVDDAPRIAATSVTDRLVDELLDRKGD